MEHLLLVSEEYRTCEEINVYLFALRTKETKLRERSAWYRIYKQNSPNYRYIYCKKYASCLLPIGPSFGKRQAPSLGTHSDTFGCLCVPEVSVSYRGDVCNVKLCLCTGILSGSGTVIQPSVVPETEGRRKAAQFLSATVQTKSFRIKTAEKFRRNCET